MIIIRNKLIPFGSFRAINLFGILFVKGDRELSEEFLNHEEIHSRQFTELTIATLMITLPLLLTTWWIPFMSPFMFYAWYSIEWIAHLIHTKDSHEAYHKISFEREAYDNESEDWYLRDRRIFSFLKYIL